MQRTELGVLRSPRDIVGVCTCEQAVRYALDALDGVAPPEPPLPGATIVAMRNGREHETAVLEQLQHDLGRAYTPQRSTPAGTHARTEELMALGVPLIEQAGLLDPTRRVFGYSDFLVRAERPSRLGAWSYDVIEAKWVGTPSVKHRSQLGFYATVVAEIQGVAPDCAVWARDDLLFDDYAELAELWDADVAAAELVTGVSTYPALCAHCKECQWNKVCSEVRTEQRDVAIAAGIGPATQVTLAGLGVRTVDDLADAEPAKATTAKRVAAANALRRSLDADETYVQVLDGAAVALNAIPDPDPADLFFDFENVELYRTGKFEYLTGFALDDTAAPDDFVAFWALDPSEEHRMVTEFVSFVEARRAASPGMHVYHFGSYERQGLRGLIARHGDPEGVVQGWLDGDLLVDLETLAKGALLVGAPSSGLKTLEKLCGFTRSGDVAAASDSMVEFHDYLTDADPARLERLEEYNREDCYATRALRDWLLELRAALETGALPSEWFGPLGHRTSTA